MAGIRRSDVRHGLQGYISRWPLGNISAMMTWNARRNDRTADAFRTGFLRVSGTRCTCSVGASVRLVRPAKKFSKGPKALVTTSAECAAVGSAAQEKTANKPTIPPTRTGHQSDSFMQFQKVPKTSRPQPAGNRLGAGLTKFGKHPMPQPLGAAALSGGISVTLALVEVPRPLWWRFCTAHPTHSPVHAVPKPTRCVASQKARVIVNGIHTATGQGAHFAEELQKPVMADNVGVELPALMANPSVTKRTDEMQKARAWRLDAATCLYPAYPLLLGFHFDRHAQDFAKRPLGCQTFDLSSHFHDFSARQSRGHWLSLSGKARLV